MDTESPGAPDPVVADVDDQVDQIARRAGAALRRAADPPDVERIVRAGRARRRGHTALAAGAAVVVVVAAGLLLLAVTGSGPDTVETDDSSIAPTTLAPVIVAPTTPTSTVPATTASLAVVSPSTSSPPATEPPTPGTAPATTPRPQADPVQIALTGPVSTFTNVVGVGYMEPTADGSTLLVEASGVMHVLDSATLEERCSFERSTSNAAISADGSVFTDGVGVWSLASCQRTGEIPADRTGERALQPLQIGISTDGSRIALPDFVNRNNSGVNVYDWRNGTQVDLVSRNDSIVFGGALDPTGDRVVTYGDAPARVFDTATGEQLMMLEADWCQAGYSPDGSRIVTATQGGWIAVWSAETGAEILREYVGMSSGFPVAADFSRDGSALIAAVNGESFTLVDAVNGDVLARDLPGMYVRSTGAAFSRDARVEAYVDHGQAQVIDTWTGDVVASIPDATRVRFSADDAFLYVAHPGGTVSAFLVDR
jgi:hypothetical protein